MSSEDSNRTSEATEGCATATTCQEDDSQKKGLQAIKDAQKRRRRCMRRYERIRACTAYILEKTTESYVEVWIDPKRLQPQMDDAVQLKREILLTQDEIFNVLDDLERCSVHDEEEEWEREFNVSWRIFEDAQIAVDQVVFEEEKVKRQSQSAILAAQQQHQKASVTSVDATTSSASATEDIPVVDEEAHQQTAVQLEEDPRDQNESPAMINVDGIRRASSSVSIHSTPTTLSTIEVAAQAAVAAMQAARSSPVVKLPQLKLSQFNGDIMDWPEFWQTFESSVGLRQSLPDVSKFTYLKSVLTGVAAAAIEGIPITAANYPIAVTMLKDKFGQPELIVATLYRKLAQLPQCNNRFTEVKATIDQMEKLLRQLEAQGENLDTQRVLIQQLFSKFPFQLISKLEEQRSDHTVPWTVKTVREMLAKYVAMQNTVRQFTDNISQTPQSKIHGHQQQHHRPPTMGFVSSQASPRREPSCVFCRSSHFSDECTNYSTLDSRKDQLLSLRRCFVCLKEGHIARNCAHRSRNCYHCSGTGHSRAICPKKGQQYNPAVEVPKHQQTNSLANGSPQTAAIAAVSPAEMPSQEPTAIPDETTELATTSVSTLKAVIQSAMLQTAKCNVTDHCGKKVTVNALLDSGSQRSFITAALAKRLQLPVQNEERLYLNTMAATKSKSFNSQSFQLAVNLRDGNMAQIMVNTLPTITNPIVKQAVQQTDLAFLEQLSPTALADSVPHAMETVNIDFLIGADYFWQLVGNNVITLPSGLKLVSSEFGYLLTGCSSLPDECSNDDTTSLVVTSSGSIFSGAASVSNRNTEDSVLSQFWQLENIGIKDSPYANDDEIALAQFRKTTEYSDGRYSIQWPWKPDDTKDQLPSNYGLALGRMKSLAKRLATDGQLLESYDKVIRQQLAKGIIEEVQLSGTSGKQHYLPHHPVVTPAKSTKVRIVYDASAKASATSPSLNDCLYRGPVLLPDLCGLLMRFRLKPIVISADVEKAFLQISIQPSDRDVTRFIWYKDCTTPEKVNGNVTAYRFCRMPFGVVSSPFLLAATIQLHLTQAQTDVSGAIARDLYVDNLITTVYSPEEGIHLYKEAKQLFSDASMNLRDWTSNSDKVLDKIQEIDRLPSASTKVLGLKWDSKADNIAVSNSINEKSVGPVTKRSVLNKVASVFDPLGLMTPSTLQGKRYLRRLWEEGLEWDAPLSAPMLLEWDNIQSALRQTTTVTIPRFIGPASASQPMSLHIFTDASKDAYAAAAYLQVQIPDSNKYTVNLIFSRSRLTPSANKPSKKQSVTIPRMELLGVVMGFRMVKFIQSQLQLQNNIPTYLWTDAKCVLHWLTTPHHLSTFVANRVKEVKSNQQLQFRHVQSQDNPADIATRGLQPEELKESSLWWQGPAWLAGDKEDWPTGKLIVTQEDIAEADKERRSPLITIGNTAAVINDSTETYSLQAAEQRVSSLRSLLRTTAICLRFIGKKIWSKVSSSTREKLRPKIPLAATVFDDASRTKYVAASDLSIAEKIIIRQHQRQNFTDAFKAIGSGTRHPLQDQLGLRLDAEGLLRCHGRLDNAQLPEDATRPMLISRHSKLSTLIIREVHARLIHAGVSHTLAQIRQKYWLPQGRAAVKAVLSKCVICQKHEGQPFRLPQMPQLPAERVQQSHPFQYIGLDYLGPFSVNISSTTQKVWVCLFTCMATRAVHLEVVMGLTTAQFVNCLKRFIARRGRPDKIISDNAPQFKLAQTYLDQKWKKILTCPELACYLAEHKVTWVFTTEFAPWQGGFYERLVGLVKRAFHKAIGRSRFTYEQFNTITTEVEAMLNTRPLTYVPSESTDGIITPNHFIAPTRSLGLPDDIQSDDYMPQRDPVATITSLQKKQQAALDTFWKLWRDDYILALRSRQPINHRLRRSRTTGPKIGDMVMIKNDQLPRGMWKMGKIRELHDSAQDGKSRSATVQTTNSILN
ncbi:uncharacterized protein LOC135810477 [Sycon ciliatum]|uniref:uncharacterized protein LOC135810477 n=1 Tax=Sycon ciliatum TaxID=27933 RepID=UPI0031F69A3D